MYSEFCSSAFSVMFSECRHFVYGQAVADHRGVRADELSFDEGDLVWVSVASTKIRKRSPRLGRATEAWKEMR